MNLGQLCTFHIIISHMYGSVYVQRHTEQGILVINLLLKLPLQIDFGCLILGCPDLIEQIQTILRMLDTLGIVRTINIQMTSHVQAKIRSDDA